MARLYAKCKVPANHTLGKIGWTLSYQDTNTEHYERQSVTYHYNKSRSLLTVYTVNSLGQHGEDIPGYSNQVNQISVTGYKQVNSSFGYTESTQSSLGYLSNVTPIDLVNITNIYNNAANKNSSVCNIENQQVYIYSFNCKSTSTNQTRVFNRKVYPSGNNTIKVAVGNDSSIYSVCFFERQGLFPAGIYKLDVQRYSQFGNIPLKKNRHIWVVTAPQKELICGTFADPYTEINLI